MTPITIQTTVQKPIELVWKKWTNPSDIMQWNHASDDWHCPRATNDLHVGGEFHYIMAARDGSTEFDFNGVYTEILPLQKIAYTIEGGRKVVVRFESLSLDQTKVIEEFEPETQNPPEMQTAGWQAIMGNFREYCEK